MMFDFSRNIYLNLILNGTTATGPLSTVALLTAMPLPNGTLTEVSGGGYTRVSTGTNWTSPTNGVSTNSAVITFPKATASWGTILGLAIMTSDGNPLFYGPLRSPLRVDASSPVISLPPGAVIVSVEGGLGTTVQNNVLTAFLRQVVPSGPATFYLGLSSTMPEPDGVTGWTEPAFINGYARTSMVNATSWNNPVITGFGYNILDVYMPSDHSSPSGTWGTAPLVAFGLWDASTGGNLWFYGKLQTPLTITETSTALGFEPGEIQIRLT